jgi:ABC-2 type transport system permease protein
MTLAQRVGLDRLTFVLVLKLLRDVRVPLVLVCLLLLLYQILWAKVTHNLLEQSLPTLAGQIPGGREILDQALKTLLSQGPGKLLQSLMGGEGIRIDHAMDMLSIGYVHPLMVTIFCIWAIGRSSGAIAGEIDRGTMELILSQPLARPRIILAHLIVDLITIPIICLSLWAGNWLGDWLLGPIEPKPLEIPAGQVQGSAPFPGIPIHLQPADPEADKAAEKEKLRISPAAFGPALFAVGSLIFAVSGFTMWLSARGRFRWRVLGTAVFIFLLMFLLNLIGQMWPEGLGWARPLNIFYYYQPQPIILGQGWNVDVRFSNTGAALIAVPSVAVLLGIGLVGYAAALGTFVRRDIPAPL